MPTVRIDSDWNHPDRMEWIGALPINKDGVIERLHSFPDEVYAKIESAIRAGNIEGNVYLADNSRFHWFLDR